MTRAHATRRAVLRAGMLTGAALLSPAVFGSGADSSQAGGLAGASPGPPAQPGGQASPQSQRADAARPASGPAAGAIPPAAYEFNQGWLFGGPYVSGSAGPGYDDGDFAPVTLPHTVTALSWGDWDHTSWENIWIYRKHFDSAGLTGGRVFADFDGVMVDATVVLNGVAVATHQGGYLPFSAELTRQLRPGRNVLAVIVDSRWLQVPPEGAAAGAPAVDFLQPGGIYRDVTLRVVPEVFLADVFAKPVAVLTPGRSLAITATIDAATVPAGPVQLTATLLDGASPVAATSASAQVTAAGISTAQLTLTGLGGVTLWSPGQPKLYTVQVTLSAPGIPPHTVTVRTGFREAVFQLDGFYLNGQRLQIFGLNRHQLFPYTGMAAPARLQRRDAEILKYELNCNMVRCSHYPQSPHFLDACDELGLMVWEEPPGWHHIGNSAWQQIVAANVHDMIVRDRNRPSVIVWATRLNETSGARALYARTRQLAYQLDGTRQTTGAMDRYSTFGWAEDVFAFDDYQQARNGTAALKRPLRGLPYLVSETVGAIDGAPAYTWTDPGPVLAEQASLHGQVHSIAALNPRYAGVLGWCGIDYASLNGGNRIWHNLKTPGVLDTFRVPKPGAAIYAAQVDPAVRPVILPVFWWYSGPGAPPGGPGPGAMVATNCDRLEVYLGGQHLSTGAPDTARFGGLRYPPVFVDLTVPGPVPSSPVPSSPAPSSPVPVPASPPRSGPVPSSPAPSSPAPFSPAPSSPVPAGPVAASPATPSPATPSPVPSGPVPASSAPPAPALPGSVSPAPFPSGTVPSGTVPSGTVLPHPVLPGAVLPGLRIDGYVGGQLVASVRMSADPALDRLVMTADDRVLEADGSDATRVTFRAVDAYGNPRPQAAGSVLLSLAGPAQLVGDNPFPFSVYGGAGGAFVRTVAGQTGPVVVTAQHPVLGPAAVQLTVVPPAAGRQFR